MKCYNELVDTHQFRKVFCPDCNRLLNVDEGKDEGDEINCPFCLAVFALEVRSFYVGILKKKSPFAFQDPASSDVGC